jgi:hypothetical protein
VSSGEPSPAGQPPEALYISLVNTRNTEVTAYWARYNIQAVLNFGLLAAVLSAKPETSLLYPLPAALPAVGVLLGIMWIAFVVVSKWVLVRRWERFLRDYEESFLMRPGAPASLAVFTAIHAEEAARSPFMRNIRNLNLLALIMPVICIGAWAWIACHRP